MVELLSGALVGAAVRDKRSARNWGNLVVALDPAMLGDPAEAQARVQDVLERVKGAARLPGVAEVLLPGERGDRVAAQRTASGLTPVESNLLSGLRAMAARSNGAATAAAPARPAAAQPAAVAAAAAPRSSNSAAGWAIPTMLLHPAPGSVVDPFDASGPPLYQSATFGQPSATECGPYDYTRSGNPTRTLLEEQARHTHTHTAQHVGAPGRAGRDSRAGREGFRGGQGGIPGRAGRTGVGR